ncbi:MAG TPA: ATP-binding protein [Alphaproteobacteria bacterium]|nr:ATP-binding protein [Alphaproteobacteria bacterium]
MPQKVRLWIIGFGAVALVAVGWLFVVRDIAQEYDRLVAAVLDRSRTRTIILREFADATFSSAALALRQLDTQSSPSGIVLPRDPALVREVLTRTAHILPFLYGLAIIDKNGNRVLTTHAPPGPDENVADRDYFDWQRSHASLDLHVSAPLVARINHRPTIPISMRISDAAGGFDGIVLAGVRPAYLEAFMSSLDADHAFIALADGTVVAGQPPPGLAADGQPRGIDPALARAWRGSPAGSSVMRFGGAAEAAGHAAIDSLPGVVSIGLDLDKELAPWRRETLHRLAGAAVYSGLVALLTWAIIAVTRRDQDTAAALRTARDEAQDARRRAEEADRNKSLFLAHTSHELRTPLNAIIGFSEVLAKEVFGPLEQRYREYSRDIHHSGQHLLSVVDNILDLAKVSAGQWELTREQFTLADLLDDVGRLAAPEAALRSVELKRVLPPDLPTLYSDRRVLRQVLLNLVINGIKFTPAGGTVGIVVTVEPEGRLVIAVLDTGIGIEPAELDKVVEPFSNVSDLIARKPGGTGLGLPLCRAFVKLLGGELTIASEVGEGTSVTVKLPPEILKAGPADDLDATAA